MRNVSTMRQQVKACILFSSLCVLTLTSLTKLKSGNHMILNAYFISVPYSILRNPFISKTLVCGGAVGTAIKSVSEGCG